MALQFYKYQGTGNDFIIIDNRENVFTDKDNVDLIARWCHRKFGVGADGFMLIEKASGYDFRMVYYNSDGKEGSMCGNGGRAIVQCAYDLGIIGEKCHFIAVDGPHDATVSSQNVALKMMDVSDVELGDSFFYMNTGSPHYVSFVDNLSDLNVVAEGKKIRYNERFKEKGTNVNFVQLGENNHIFVRTYERGVEDETLSCGTGVTACAIASFLKGRGEKIAIETLGGHLEVAFNPKQQGQFDEVFLIGPAKRVFVGEIPY